MRVQRRPVYSFLILLNFYFLKIEKIRLAEPLGVGDFEVCDLIFEYSIGVYMKEVINPHVDPNSINSRTSKSYICFLLRNSHKYLDAVYRV